MKINESLVYGYPTDPNILGPTQTSLQLFRILKSFLDFLKRFSLFPCIIYLNIITVLPTYGTRKINFHGVSGSVLFRNIKKFAFLLLNHLLLGTLGVSIEKLQCNHPFLSAMPRCVAVVNIML